MRFACFQSVLSLKKGKMQGAAQRHPAQTKRKKRVFPRENIVKNGRISFCRLHETLQLEVVNIGVKFITYEY